MAISSLELSWIAGRGSIRALALVCAGMIAAGMIAASGCTRQNRVETGSATIQVQLWNDPVTLDPSMAEDVVSMRVLNNTMDGLLGYDGEGKVQNLLAESFTVSPDGKRYEFTLRKGAAWSDGRLVSAGDFVFGMRRVLMPETGAKLSHFLFPIRGARELNAGKAKPESLGVFEKDGKLVIELVRPVSYFPEILCLTVAMPIREDFLAAQQGRWDREAPVTGPYRIRRQTPDQELLLEPNPKYWRKVPAHSVLLRIVRDDSTSVNLFENGKLDILTRVPTLDYKRLKEMGVVHTDPFLATYYIAFNVRKGPFADRELRRAVAGAIRKDEIVAAVETPEIPARSWIPPGLDGYLAFEGPDAALSATASRMKARLAKEGPLSAVAAFDASERNTTVMSKVQQDLKAHLGISLQLESRDWKAHIRRITTEAPPIYRFGWLSPFRDPVPHLQVFTSGNANNYTGWTNPRYDRLVSDIETLSAGSERTAKILEAQKLLVEDEVPVVPIYHYVQSHAVSKRIGNFRVNPLGIVVFDELEIKQSP